MKSLATLACTILAATMAFAEAIDRYDPLEVEDTKIESKTFDMNYPKADRVLPVRIYLPKSESPAPVILFSHGLGGSRDNNPNLGNHWAARGYVVVFVQHPGSDERVWKEVPLGQRMNALGKAASTENFTRRGEDIPVVIDYLTKWNVDKDHPLHGRLDLKHIGMSGHSFGANTTQAIAGQKLTGGRFSFREPRISAAVMMSPNIPVRGDPAEAFATITIPCLLMTGTLDDSPISNTKAADRKKVFSNLTAAPAWQVVFDKATHMSFGDRDLKGESENGNRYHKPILALTTAFWDAELKGESAAKAWLKGPGAKSALTSEDQWEMNQLANKSD